MDVKKSSITPNIVRRHRVNKIFNSIDKTIENITFAAFVLAIVVMFTQVAMRYLFHHSLFWAEEFSRMMFIWIVYFGTPIVIRRGANIEVDFLTEFLPPKIKKHLKTVMYTISSVFLIFVAYYGGLMVLEHMGKTARTMPISQAFWYLPIALGCLMMAINMIRSVFEIYQEKDNSTNETGGGAL